MVRLLIVIIIILALVFHCLRVPRGFFVEVIDIITILLQKLCLLLIICASSCTRNIHFLLIALFIALLAIRTSLPTIMDSQIARLRSQIDHRSETSFLNVQGPEIDDVFGGLTVRQDGTLKIPDHYKKLRPTLQAYLRQDQRFNWGTNPTKREWEALFNDLAAAEVKANDSGSGSADAFGHMLVKIGERADRIDPWINLIPDEFGLCVVKSAFALLLDTAKSDSERRQAISDAFLVVRDAIADASSKGIHFQTEPSVYRAAGDLYESIADAIQELLSLVKTQKQLDVTTIEWPINNQKTEPDIGLGSSVQREASRAVISLDRLVKILSAPSPGRILAQDASIDLNVLFLRQRDLERILQNTARFDPRAESRAHTILNQDRFSEWMQQDHPDMPLVDGGIPGSAQDAISPMSLLCANLSLVLGEHEPNSIFAIFYCGLHTRPYNDDWYGPSGMLRSSIAQVLLALIERNFLDLGCLGRRGYVRGLERHDLGILCDLLSDLVCQFDAETIIYVIIDGVSKFDVDYNNIFQRLKVAIRRFGDIVKDDELRLRLKILMTVPFRSSIRSKNIVDTKFQLASLQQLLAPNKLSKGSILSSILSPSTLQSAATTSSLQNDLPEWGSEDYDDE
ncbi:hypothetical protein BDP81DRAFT_395710 [Colletotrichum phormii]|uniref:Uncharacterized protein n=1 Tax=Colletotrichum phormii TaxID=359342 RepID=A0AAI9ZQP6_9PEZI|nr:uncharacterized protein BDP81DRAFT_395710 [Colletotrichum phormii]KAK1635253.1 hypothetical protein BDP81DRAFT_395710 [Colletotrichum phormii]